MSGFNWRWWCAAGLALAVAFAAAVAPGCSDEPAVSVADGDTGVSAETTSDATSDAAADTLPDEDNGRRSCELTDWERVIWERHNQYRAAVDPPADAMYRVYWDEAVAANAAAYVSSCDPEWPHSSQESREGVGGFPNLGENLYWCGGCDAPPGVADDSGRGTGQGWFDERLDYDFATDESTGVTSHYTQMVSSNVYAIGCASQRCDPPGPGGWDGEWWWTICQYGPRGQAYWVGDRPYEEGAGGLVEPPADIWDDHPALCEPK